MRLTVLGAPGGPCRQVVEQALAAGHEVTALARDPGKLGLNDPRLRVVQGAVQDAAAVEQAVSDADAVISTLGPRSNEPVFEISQGMDVILPAMQQCGVRRFVMTAGMGIADPQDKPGSLNRVISLLLGLMAKNVAEDMQRAVAKAQASGLDWTVLRAPRLVDKPGGRPLKYGYVGQGVGFELARADFARALLDAATTGQYARQMPGVSN
jgi:putative NADH-flavin reductase